MNKREAKSAALQRIIADINADISAGGVFTEDIPYQDAAKIEAEMVQIRESLDRRLARLECTAVDA